MGNAEFKRAPSPTIEIVVVDEDVLLEAQALVAGCEHCNLMRPDLTFDYLLDAITGRDPTITEYLMSKMVHCPRCKGEITEKTRIIVA